MTSSAASILSSPSHVTSIVMEYLQTNNLTSKYAMLRAKEKQTKQEVAVYDVFARIVIKQSVSSVIFLDIDGVLFNRPNDGSFEATIDRLYPHIATYDRDSSDIAASHLFSKAAVSHLEKLIRTTKEVAVVLSSDWREYRLVRELREVFSFHAFSQFLIDRTPDNTDEEYAATKHLMTDHSGRGKQIAYWLQEHPITNFVILDDNDKGLSKSFRDRFVKTEMSTLLTEVDAYKASKILNNKA